MVAQSLASQYIKGITLLNTIHNVVQWNNFSEDNSVADSHSFNIMFQIFPTTEGNGEYLGEFPIFFIFLYEQKWVTATKFGKRLANRPLAALLFIVFFQFDSQIH